MNNETKFLMKRIKRTGGQRQSYWCAEMKQEQEKDKDRDDVEVEAHELYGNIGNIG